MTIAVWRRGGKEGGPSWAHHMRWWASVGARGAGVEDWRVGS